MVNGNIQVFVMVTNMDTSVVTVLCKDVVGAMIRREAVYFQLSVFKTKNILNWSIIINYITGTNLKTIETHI